MIRDPYYRVMVERLGGGLDPDFFERCAADLLRHELPTLVPIRGGADAGMDGAVADGTGEAYPLISTTGKDVIGNLTRNLDSYVSNGGERRRVVLATSQDLSARKRRNVSERASEKGFELVQIYDRAAFADRLYHDSRWCKELLGLTGAPSALSAVPLTRRLLVNIGTVGREGELSWLRESCGDRLLLGPSGSGKTFLLYTLVLEGWSLFLVSEDLAEIAAAVRDRQPGVVIVDDAHLDPERLVELRRLRDETGTDFSIVATVWKGEEDPVVEALGISSLKIRELDLLGRDEIVKVVEESGVRRPLWLVRDIVDQAEGKPGLAGTLSQLCLQGGVREVALGEHLLRQTVGAFGRLVGLGTMEVLAAFALGGEAGMPQSSVVGALGIPPYELHSAVTRLAVGGVVDRARAAPWGSTRRGTAEGADGVNLVVRPANLRYALVKDVFFGDTPPLPYGVLLDSAPDASEVARTLVRGPCAIGGRLHTKVPRLREASRVRIGERGTFGRQAWTGQELNRRRTCAPLQRGFGEVGTRHLQEADRRGARCLLPDRSIASAPRRRLDRRGRVGPDPRTDRCFHPGGQAPRAWDELDRRRAPDRSKGASGEPGSRIMQPTSHTLPALLQRILEADDRLIRIYGLDLPEKNDEPTETLADQMKAYEWAKREGKLHEIRPRTNPGTGEISS